MSSRHRRDAGVPLVTARVLIIGGYGNFGGHIARALAADPQLIICDEVTSALDQLVAEGVLKLLNRIQQQLGVAYLFITHDVATVRAIADEVVVMQRGRVVDQGSRSAIFTPPYQDYTGLLFSSEPEMDPDWLDHLLAERAALTS